MNAVTTRYIILWVFSAAFIAAFATYSSISNINLGQPEFITGYVLFGLMLGLATFNARKKLSMVPFGRSAYWLAVHVVGGIAALGLFFIHTGNVWPTGAYEQALAIVFYLVTISGIFGYIIQKIYPKRLVQTELEIIYERIPAELSELREKSESITIACTENTGSDTLARHYMESLRWYFQRPRFFLSHTLGGAAAEHWINQSYQTVSRYLSEAEREYLNNLNDLAKYKSKIDFHFACQSMMKYWLLAHVPLAAAVLALIFWHVIVVNVYAL
tara:strand:+ start:22952 stop:23767 length:816 start_codon:yes stop_codon:yes gene_type:complete